MNRRAYILLLVGLLVACAASTDRPGGSPATAGLSPESWLQDYTAFLDRIGVVPTEQPIAIGQQSAVATGYFGLASRAGIEALRRGGSAADAALTTALTQIALDAGMATSYFGVMAFLYYDAETGVVHAMNADWNSVLEDGDPESIPGGSPIRNGRLADLQPSGRTALVGGFMKGVESVHQRFGTLPFQALFEPAIYVARNGFPVSAELADAMARRADDLGRLPETASVFLTAGRRPYREGELFRQPALARTLTAIAAEGADYMYSGRWGERLVSAVQADGGRMTLDDLTRYDVMWQVPLSASINGFTLHTMPRPIQGGVLMIEAQNLAVASGLSTSAHWREDAASLRRAATIAQATMMLDFTSDRRFSELYPMLDRTDETRVTPEWAASLWSRMDDGTLPMNWQSPGPRHSDVVVVADARGNIAVIGHSINTILWGKTAITVGGVTVSDSGSFLRGLLADIDPGERVPGIAQIGILTRAGEAELGFASKGNGMHHRTFQGLVNFIHHEMPIDDAVDAPDFFMPARDPESRAMILRVPEGRFPRSVLDETGWRYLEIPLTASRTNGEGVWIGVSRDPETGLLKAASNRRSNSAAIAD